MIFSNSIIQITTFSAISTFCWYAVYKKFRQLYKWEEEFCARVVAAIHAVIVVILSFISIKYGPDPIYSPGEDNTDLQVLTMLVSIGYFVYDFGWCIKHQPEPKIMLYHHLASICAIYYILLHGSSGSEAVGGLGSLELTNPLLQIRWLLRYLGYMDTIVYKVIEVTFFILFLLVRLGYGSWLLIAVVGSQKSAIPVKICTILLYLISLAFIYSIGRFVIRKLLRGPGKPGDAAEDDDDVKLS
ncbi:unnamed protein product [Nezara viridula]|uniref:TLC domain-containing protein n=1 Tax=Nezara viridula TaxID=85310 RepID=A0A9P0HP88_NEZVI|nr:unnamed protein product [Nezara viridula]